MKKFILGVLVLTTLFSCSKNRTGLTNTIFVSIPPQKYFVQKIVGDRFKVLVMVGKGQNPATYDILPSQLTELASAKIYFRIGVPFENAWIGRISNTYKKIKIIDTRNGIKLRQMRNFKELFENNENISHEHIHKEAMDPHIWTSPPLVKIQAKTIANAIINEDPANRDFYIKNLNMFLKEMDLLDKKIRIQIEKNKISNFMVFHPSWGYFADTYGLKQIPIEIEGKEPSAKMLSLIIDYAKKNNIRVIFAQPEFSTKSAKKIAEAINGKLLLIDPLAENYTSNMLKIAKTLTESIND